MPSWSGFFQHGADPNTPDRRGRTPLHLAIAHDGGASACLLIDSGANVDALSEGSAASERQRHVYAMNTWDGLEDSSCSRHPWRQDTPLTLACATGGLAHVCLLIKHGANPDVVEFGKASPLTVAIEHTIDGAAGNLPVVLGLIRAGANVNMPAALRASTPNSGALAWSRRSGNANATDSGMRRQPRQRGGAGGDAFEQQCGSQRSGSDGLHPTCRDSRRLGKMCGSPACPRCQHQPSGQRWGHAAGCSLHQFAQVVYSLSVEGGSRSEPGDRRMHKGRL